MSSSSTIAIILARTPQDRFVPILEQSLSSLIQDYGFDFRGTGGVCRSAFEAETYEGQDEATENFESVSDIDKTAIKLLIDKYQWFEIIGSIRAPEDSKLYSISLMLYPSFDKDRPASIVFSLPSSLFRDVYGDGDVFNQEAAELLRRFAVRLGANEQVEGFHMLYLRSLEHIKTFDGATLRRYLLEPAPIRDVLKGIGIPPGLITGIKSSIMPLDEIPEMWKEGHLFETVSGFSVIDGLVPIRKTMT